MTTLLTQIYSAHGGLNPQSAASFVLPTIHVLTFSLNDPDSQPTQGLPRLIVGTPLASSTGTANFDNPQYKDVEIGQYESLIRSIPPPYGKSCDYLLLTRCGSHFVFIELKEFAGKLKEPRAQLRQSLRDVWPTATTRFANCANKWCCLFRQVPVTATTAPAITAVPVFNSINTQTGVKQSGVLKADSDMNAFGFSFWIFTNAQRCTLI